jgi:hypothetical protein
LIASGDGYDFALQAIGHFTSRLFTRYGERTIHRKQIAAE